MNLDVLKFILLIINKKYNTTNSILIIDLLINLLQAQTSVKLALINLLYKKQGFWNMRKRDLIYSYLNWSKLPNKSTLKKIQLSNMGLFNIVRHVKDMDILTRRSGIVYRVASLLHGT